MTAGKKPSSPVRVTIEIDPEDWWQVARRADREGRRVADVVRDAVLVAGGARAVSDEERRLVERLGEIRAAFVQRMDWHNGEKQTMRGRVLQMVLEGSDDGAISRATGLSRGTVAVYRRTAGLRPNRASGGA